MGCSSLQISPADQILDLVYAHTNSMPGRPLSHALNARKVQRYIDGGQPLQFVLPAFPAKSPNREKTLGPLADQADLEGLRTLNQLAEEIQRLYAPGARILICSDGRVFADVVQISDMDVENYKRGIEQMLVKQHLNHLDTFHLEDIFGFLSFPRMREKLTANYAIPLEKLREQAREEDALRLMFNGIHRFMFEDQLALNPNLSREKARQMAKPLAYQVIQRSNAWSALIEERFPQALRLSIHPQISLSPKMGVQLVKAKSGWCTPWHSVLVSNGLKKRLMKRSEAEALGARLTKSPEGYAFFALEANHAL